MTRETREHVRDESREAQEQVGTRHVTHDSVLGKRARKVQGT